MNFFEAQGRTHRNSRYLLLLFAAATVAVVIAVTALISATLLTTRGDLFNTNLFVWASNNAGFLGLTALAVFTFISLASLIRIAGLREGGSRVARDLGAIPLSPDTQDVKELQLRNVVEEMALASGTPAPEIFILDQEAGINAFAAGFRPEDAAVAVTRGALELLDRDELQGVIAHEFSHILNGDMRLNIQLMGPLYGISAVALLGRAILRGAGRTRRVKGSAAGGIMILGVGLAITGYAGMFCARLIKAAVSRQREYLADASAVQFTRQVDGILGALTKIKRHSAHGRLQVNEGEEISHMLFATGGRAAFAQMLATHPPLKKRILAIDPDGIYGAQIDDALEAAMDDDAAPNTAAGDERTSGFAATSAAVVASIGNPGAEHVAAATGIHRNLSVELLDAARSRDSAPLLMLALGIHSDSNQAERQFDLLTGKLGELRCKRIQTLYAELQNIAPSERLALVEIAFPVFKRRPDGELEFVLGVLDDVIAADQHIDLFEFALSRLLRNYLQRAAAPAGFNGQRSLTHRHTKRAVQFCFAALAVHGNNDSKDKALDAFRFGLKELNCPPASTEAEQKLLNAAAKPGWTKTMDQATDRLQLLSPAAREQLITTLIDTSLRDHSMNEAETVLLQAICGILDAPLPPLTSANRTKLSY